MMTVDTWGRAGWVFLHAISFSYSDSPSVEEKEYMRRFLHSIGYVLPCPTCKSHYRDFMQGERVEHALSSREALTQALWELHNEVNERNEKAKISYDDLCKRYTTSKSTKCLTKPPSSSFPSGPFVIGGSALLVLLLVGTVALIVMGKKKKKR